MAGAARRAARSRHHLYLLGKAPPAFDVLFWNQDTVRLAAGPHRDFIHLSLENSLTRAGALEVLGSGVDLACASGEDPSVISDKLGHANEKMTFTVYRQATRLNTKDKPNYGHRQRREPEFGHWTHSSA